MQILSIATFLVLALVSAVTACESQSIDSRHRDLARHGELLVLAGRPFTGIVETRRAGKLLEQTPYKNGLIQGLQEVWHANGQIAQRRVFAAGKKIGQHRGWYPDGRLRFVYEFAAGVHHGEFWEWHQSGGLHQFARYERGRQIGKKIWRADGKIYANYVYDGGQTKGLRGDHLCRLVESDANGRTTSIH